MGRFPELTPVHSQVIELWLATLEAGDTSVCPHAFRCRTIYLCPIFVLYEFHHNILSIGSPFSTSWTTRFLGARGVVFSGVVLSRSWVTCTWAIFFFFLARSPAHCYGLPLPFRTCY